MSDKIRSTSEPTDTDSRATIRSLTRQRLDDALTSCDPGDMLALIAGGVIGVYVAHDPSLYTVVAEWLVVGLGGARLVTRARPMARNQPKWLRPKYLDAFLVGIGVMYLAVHGAHGHLPLADMLDSVGIDVPMANNTTTGHH